MHNRIKDIYALFAALALLAVLFLSPDARADGPAGVSAVSPENAWRFRVFLDDREIGYHHFYLAGEEGIEAITAHLDAGGVTMDADGLSPYVRESLDYWLDLQAELRRAVERLIDGFAR